jgi:hypothetical protein
MRERKRERLVLGEKRKKKQDFSVRPPGVIPSPMVPTMKTDSSVPSLFSFATGVHSWSLPCESRGYETFLMASRIRISVGGLRSANFLSVAR